MINVVIGSQWGDEGKGKFTDYFAQESDIVARFQGGNNAGHTIKVKDVEYKLHLIPSGIVTGKICLIGNGVVVDLQALNEEIEYLKEKGITVTPDNLIISDRAHVIMPYHKELDKIQDSIKDNPIGTTGKGIGTCYAEKMNRTGIRIIDLFDSKLADKIFESLKNQYTTIFNKGEIPEPKLDYFYKYADNIILELKPLIGKIKPFVRDTSVYINEQLEKGKTVLAEGSQGMLLDIDHGTYPFVTSSNISTASVLSGLGVSFKYIDKVYGIAKAYTTRVGEGVFPTELNNEIGDWLCEKGFEYGVTTGRKRRCGWLDLVIIKNAVRVCGINNLVLTKMDTLAGLETIKVCIGYKINGKVIDYIPSDLSLLERALPIYKEFKGWNDIIAEASKYDEIPDTAKDYIKFIEDFLKCKVSIVSIGADRNKTLVRD